MKLVALCDSWKERLVDAGKRYGVATYTDYDKFLEHDMDAVVLANYFHEHAPFAIKALAAGKHVMSECTSNATLAEGRPDAGLLEFDISRRADREYEDTDRGFFPLPEKRTRMKKRLKYHICALTFQCLLVSFSA